MIDTRKIIRFREYGHGELGLPFRTETIVEMASVICRNNPEAVIVNLQNFILENKKNIISSMHRVLHPNHVSQLNPESYEMYKETRKDINLAIKHLTKTYGVLLELRDHNSKKHFVSRALTEMEPPIGNNLSKTMEEWRSIIENIREELEFLKKFRDEVSRLSGRGRPNTVRDLENFIYQLALCYQTASCKPFTFDKLNEYDGGCVTDGMFFCEIALKAITHDRPIKKSSFENACQKVTSRLKLLEKIT